MSVWIKNAEGIAVRNGGANGTSISRATTACSMETRSPSSAAADEIAPPDRALRETAAATFGAFVIR